MTERENALRVYHHEMPEWIPNVFDSVCFIGFWGNNECGQRGKQIGDTIYLDCFGVPWDMKAGMPTPAVMDPILTDIEDWRNQVTIPDARTWDWDLIKKTELKDYDGTKLLNWFCEQGLWDRLTALMGFEEAACALLINPDECCELFEAITEYKIGLIEMVAKHIKPDVFMYTDDLAKSDGLFMSPDTYRELIKPFHKRIIQAIRDNGMIAEQHTCGKCDELAGDYAEIGVQSFYPAQPSNDIVAIKEKYGDKMIISGGFDSQGACGSLDADEETMRAEARRMIDSYAKGGGYIAIPLIMGGSDFMKLEVDRQIWFMDEFHKYGKDFYSKPENQ